MFARRVYYKCPKCGYSTSRVESCVKGLSPTCQKCNTLLKATRSSPNTAPTVSDALETMGELIGDFFKNRK